MIVGAAAVPSTALLVSGVSRRLPDGLRPLADATGAALDGLPPADVIVLVAGIDNPAAGGPSGHRDLRQGQSPDGDSRGWVGEGRGSSDGRRDPPRAAGARAGHNRTEGRGPFAVGDGERPRPRDAAVLYGAADGSLAGIARPDLRATAPVHLPAVEAIQQAAGCEVRADGLLPLDLAVLLHLARARHRVPVVPLAVSPAEPETLLALGSAVADGLAGTSKRANVVAAADLSAGRTIDAPLGSVRGAAGWDDEVVDIVASGRLDRLVRLGPAEAQRVGARGWAPLVVLHGVCRAARLAMVVRAWGAPRGVGYLVGAGG